MLLFYMPGACSLAEIVALEWIGEPYELCRVSREDRQRPEFLALNPHGAVPLVRIGDRVLTENAAILLHLADRHPAAKLAPQVGTDERDRLHFWLSYLASGFHVAHYPIFKAARFHSDEAVHPALVARAKERVLEELRFVDRELDGREYILDSGRSVLDAYLPAMARWGRRFFDYAQEVPDLDRYLLALDEDPGMQRSKAIESGELDAPSGAFTRHVPFAEAAA